MVYVEMVVHVVVHLRARQLERGRAPAGGDVGDEHAASHLVAHVRLQVGREFRLHVGQAADGGGVGRIRGRQRGSLVDERDAEKPGLVRIPPARVLVHVPEEVGDVRLEVGAQERVGVDKRLEFPLRDVTLPRKPDGGAGDEASDEIVRRHVQPRGVAP